MMNCNEIQPNLMDYSLGRLTRSETEAIAKHVKACEECRAVLEEEHGLGLYLEGLGQVAPRNDVWALIRSRTRPRASMWALLRTRTAKLVAATAATAAVALTVISMYPGNQPSQPDESIKAVTTIMISQPVPERSLDDPLGTSTDALAATLDEGT